MTVTEAAFAPKRAKLHKPVDTPPAPKVEVSECPLCRTVNATVGVTCARYGFTAPVCNDDARSCQQRFHKRCAEYTKGRRAWQCLPCTVACASVQPHHLHVVYSSQSQQQPCAAPFNILSLLPAQFSLGVRHCSNSTCHARRLTGTDGWRCVRRRGGATTQGSGVLDTWHCSSTFLQCWRACAVCSCNWRACRHRTGGF